MELSSTGMYWITRLDGINMFFMIIGVLLFAVWSCWYMLTYIDNEFINHRTKTIKGVLTGLLMIFISVMIPTTGEMAAILIIPKIVNNKNVQNMPDKLLQYSNLWLDEKIKEIKGERNGE